MAETTVQQKVCKACGVDVRPNSLFCYNCGKPVSVEENGNDEISDVWLRENIAEEADETAEEAEKVDEKEPEIVKPNIVLKESESEKAAAKLEEGKLKSASAMRQKAKSYQQKQIEVVWEDAESVSNAKLIAAAILLLIFAGALVGIAFYLK
ncbi:MAG: zinc ribbon domain-containing protein [Pyrinomonadaceae bacterium]|nr:zinc ribbon domain-containing protein [Pyrinomonadaceae bacterium]